MCRSFDNGRDGNPMILGIGSIFNYINESVYFIFAITSILFNLQKGLYYNLFSPILQEYCVSKSMYKVIFAECLLAFHQVCVCVGGGAHCVNTD